MEYPSASPRCTIKQKVGLTSIEIDYSRPGMRGRQIFGGIVPFDKLWRTGGNEATKVTFSTPVKLNGVEIEAGTYALLSVPGESEWTLVVNKDANQWGAYKYDQKKDVVRFSAKPVTVNESLETFEIDIRDIKDDSASITIGWDKTLVPIKLEVDVVDEVMAGIKEFKALKEEQKGQDYFMAAKFYYKHNKDLEQALQWVNKAVAQKDAFHFSFLQAQILAKLGERDEAIVAAKRANEMAAKWNETAVQMACAELIESLN